MTEVQSIAPRLTFLEKIRGKRHAAATLVELARYFANWQGIWSAYRNGLPLPDLVTRDGLRIRHACEDVALTIFHEIFHQQTYTRGFYTPQAGDAVVDLGANIGLFGLFLISRARQVRLACFEPAAATYQRLLDNIECNGLAKSIVAYRFAISSNGGRARLGRSRSSVERGLVAGQEEGEEVPALRLADALERAGMTRVNLLKVDIEGAELEVIESTPREIWTHIERVALEYHGSSEDACGERVGHLLRERGFNRIALQPASSGHGILRAARVR